jgi:alpha-glucosidase (family GH31 glycosyl hydrolase)
MKSARPPSRSRFSLARVALFALIFFGGTLLFVANPHNKAVPTQPADAGMHAELLDSPAEPKAPQPDVLANRVHEVVDKAQHEAADALEAVKKADAAVATFKADSTVKSLFLDRGCGQLAKDAAMTSDAPRFELTSHVREGVFSVELFNEAARAKADGERKAGTERAQFLPDDVVVLDAAEQSCLPAAYSGADGRVAFAPCESEPEPMAPTAAALHCSVEDGFVFEYGPPAVTGRRTMNVQITGANGRLALGTDDVASPTKVTMKSASAATRFYGLANRGKGGRLSDDASFEMLNLDVNHYELKEAQSLYGAIPLVYAVDATDGTTCGVLVLNGSPLSVRAHRDGSSASVSVSTSDGGVRVFFFEGPTPAKVLQQYYEVTGRPAMPALFALGYHQCRWSYRDQADVLSVNRGFNEHDIPCDAIWLDIDHTDGKRYFTWDGTKFPDSVGMQNTLWESGRRMVTITDPHIKIDTQYHVYNEGRAGGHFIQRGGRDFEGDCWPGRSVWIDFLEPAARAWYASLWGKYEGATEHLFAWIDMNEPSVFGQPRYMMPHDARHHGHVRHEQAANLYGFYHSMAAFTGLAQRSKDTRRPFVLTRSFFAGSQRYAAMWTGDNQAKFSHLAGSIEMVLTLSMCGMPFSGADVGGFFDNPAPELLARWYQLGAVYPFFRGHSHEQTHRREPWLTRGLAGDRIRDAIRLRYTLMPYLYTAAAEAYAKGEPGIMRHLMMEFPADPTCHDVLDTFMVGPSLLARPITDEGVAGLPAAQYHAFIPRHPHGGGTTRPLWWHSFYSGAGVVRPDQDGGGNGRAGYTTLTEERGASLPLFQRAGSVIVTKVKVGRSTADLDQYGNELRIVLDDLDEATGALVLDDGVSFDFESTMSAEGVPHLPAACTVTFRFSNDTLCALPEAGCNYETAATNVVEAVRLMASPLPKYRGAKVTSGSARGLPLGKGRVLDLSQEALVRLSDLSLPLTPKADARGAHDGALWCMLFT